jgi:hypothetical protein
MWAEQMASSHFLQFILLTPNLLLQIMYDIITYLELCDANNGYDRLYNMLWLRADYVFGNTRVHKAWATGCHGYYILYSGASYLWVCCMDIASCHTTDT